MLTPGRSAAGQSGYRVWVVVQKVATWAETGVGIVYSKVDGAHVCFSRAANYYVALNAYHFPDRAR
jgi:hypothetical protein